jgi:hypothetical protein
MGLTNISAEMHADRQAREYRAGKARRPKTFRERYGDRVADQLLLVANAVENDLLPPFYQELGSRQKGDSERVLLQRELDQSAEFFGVLSFKVTPSQVIAPKTFYFADISMAEVGTGVLPLTIIPSDTTSLYAARSIANNHAQSDTYDLSDDPSSGALSAADTQHLRNQKGYLPWDWMEARSQLFGNLSLLDALCGNDHGKAQNWQTMLRRFDGVDARLQHKMNTQYGPRLAPALFVFHLQLIERDWFVESTQTGQRTPVLPPDVCQYLRIFERQNNLHWLSLVTNIPSLFELLPTAIAPRAPVVPRAPLAHLAPRGGTAQPAAGGAFPPAPAGGRRGQGPRVRNPGRDTIFTGNSALARNARTRRVNEAISLAGGDAAVPKVTRGGEEIIFCVSYHVKGVCYAHRIHVATHTPLAPAKATPFNEWCTQAFA